MKSVKEPKIRVGATRRNLQAQPKNLKKCSEHRIYQSEQKFSQKKVCLVPQKCKGAKNSYGGYPTEFAGSTQNPKKMTGRPNLPIKKKIVPKKICLVP
jgi:hypothetical protein